MPPAGDSTLAGHTFIHKPQGMQPNTQLPTATAAQTFFPKFFQCCCCCCHLTILLTCVRACMFYSSKIPSALFLYDPFTIYHSRNAIRNTFFHTTCHLLSHVCSCLTVCMHLFATTVSNPRIYHFDWHLSCKLWGQGHTGPCARQILSAIRHLRVVVPSDYVNADWSDCCQCSTASQGCE